MDEYIWVGALGYRQMYNTRVYPVLTRLAEKHGIRISPVISHEVAGEKFAKVVNNAIARKVSGIMIAFPDYFNTSEAIVPVLDAGIPVIAIEGKVSPSRPVASVGTDWYRMGAEMAERTAELIDGTGKILVVANTGYSPRIHAALAGFHFFIGDYYRIHRLGKGDAVSPADMAAYVRRNKDLAAVIAIDDDSLAAWYGETEKESFEGAFPIVATGYDLTLASHVQAGQIHTLYTPRIEASVALAVSMLRANRQATVNGVDTGYEIVTAENAQEIVRKVERWAAGEVPDVDYPVWVSGGSPPDRRDSGTDWMRSRAILEAIPDLIFQIDRNHRFINYKADRQDVLYLPPDEFLGKTIDEVLPPYLAKLTKKSIEKVLASGKVETYEYVLEIAGKLSQFEARIAATGPDDVIVIIRDITERSRAEDALRESEERFRVAFKTSPDAMAITRIEDGLILDVNDGFTQITGYTREELVGKTVFDLDIWHDHRDRERMTGALRERGYVMNLEAKFRLKGNRIHTGLQSARVIQLHGVNYILSVTRDIQEWKQAQQALRESEERFRAVFETAQDAIYIKDRDRKYVAVNPSFARLPGIPAADFIGKIYEDIFGPVNAETNRAREERVLGGDIVSEESVRIINGGERIFHIVMVPMRVNGGEIIGLCGIAREITEMKQLQESAERARRLEMAGTIAGQVAHDFNNLLGPLMAYPDIIRESLGSESAVHQYLNDIEQAAEQMADINQQLLTLGRRGHYSREIFNINEIIGYVLEHMPPPRPSISTETELADDLMNVNGGASQIYRVVSNLVNNAYDAMPGGGRLLCRTENIYVDKAIGKYGRIPVGEFVKITISDTGSGIPGDILPHIFDPFYTTKTTDRKRGSGLGLSVVHAVIDDHKGYIDVESSPGKGTTFFIYLPVTREDSEMANSAEIVGGTERILVVDDDRVQLEVAQTILSRLGYIVQGAESSAEALTLLRKYDYDLLLLDMVMPSGVDGAELYRRALAIRPEQPAIMMSGFAESERVKRALALGAGQFLRKPLTLQALASAIRMELDKRVRG